jgi:hypothetical protein
MKIIHAHFRRCLLLVSALVPACLVAQVPPSQPPFPQTAGVPVVIDINQNRFQQETHFLTFLGSFIPESNVSEAAYYDAIDPAKAKRTFTAWLKNAGFIGQETDWNPTGPQLIACNLPGCDKPAGTYGPNIVNADAHVIVLNAADLGFVRNQFIRCVPSCTAANPIIYTYLENYPVNPFATSEVAGNSGFPIKSGYLHTSEATAAIASALNRPAPGSPAPAGCTNGDTFLGCGINRIADVAFEWAPPPGSSATSKTRYGTTWAFQFGKDPATGKIVETITSVAGIVGSEIPVFSDPTGSTTTIQATDPFPPNLDFRGFKEHPGVCFICHGGSPKNLTSLGQYPSQGKVNGFRFLPLDIRNLMFTSDLGPDQPALPASQAFTDRFNQEAAIKAYNIAVLATVPKDLESDGTGAVRQAHLREAITGWYTDPGSPAFNRTTQNTEFLPVGWREPPLGTAPAGSKNLYQQVVSPSCRSCHFNREVSLDFGTAANFKQNSDLRELALKPWCNSNTPHYSTDPKLRPMPLALLTFQRFWEAQVTPQQLPYPANPNPPGPLTLSSTADQLAIYFGYANVQGYCATNP